MQKNFLCSPTFFFRCLMFLGDTKQPCVSHIWPMCMDQAHEIVNGRFQVCLGLMIHHPLIKQVYVDELVKTL